MHILVYRHKVIHYHVTHRAFQTGGDSSICWDSFSLSSCLVCTGSRAEGWTAGQRQRLHTDCGLQGRVSCCRYRRRTGAGSGDAGCRSHHWNRCLPLWDSLSPQKAIAAKLKAIKKGIHHQSFVRCGGVQCILLIWFRKQTTNTVISILSASQTVTTRHKRLHFHQITIMFHRLPTNTCTSLDSITSHLPFKCDYSRSLTIACWSGSCLLLYPALVLQHTLFINCISSTCILFNLWFLTLMWYYGHFDPERIFMKMLMLFHWTKTKTLLTLGIKTFQNMLFLYFFGIFHTL